MMRKANDIRTKVRFQHSQWNTKQFAGVFPSLSRTKEYLSHDLISTTYANFRTFGDIWETAVDRQIFSIGNTNGKYAFHDFGPAMKLASCGELNSLILAFAPQFYNNQ